MIDLTFTNSSTKKTYTRKFFLNILEQAVNEFKYRTDLGLSVNLVGKPKIQALNKKHRKKDKPTDVLSFPLSTKIGAKKSENDIVELGDIFICSDVVPILSSHYSDIQNRGSSISHPNKNLGEIGTVKKTKPITMKKAMALVTVHGFLHLLGYDHERSKSEEKKMFSLQDKILNKLKF